MKELAGRVAVVTGAASGIGRALADRFAAENMKVVLADVEDGPLQEAVDQIRSRGAEAIGVRTDVRFENEVQRLADRTIEAFGAVHVLCNNAGVETGDEFADIPLASWKWVLDVNLYGMLHGCRTFLPLIREQGEGHIVNTASGASFGVPAPTFAPYCTSKYAAFGLTVSLDAELRASGENIGVSLLAPGAIKTNMTEAERNRPADVPSTADDPMRTRVMGALRQFTAEHGMEASEVADMVIGAIDSGQFFILTHPDHSIAAVRAQLARMEGGPPPAPSPLGASSE